MKSNNKYNYSNPLYIDYDQKYFLAQSIRDIDFSMIVKSGDIIEIYFLEYTKKNYQKCNINNISPQDSNMKILGNYSFTFNAQNNLYKNNMEIVLNSNDNLTLNITYFLRESENDYILTTPLIKGNINYINFI